MNWNPSYSYATIPPGLTEIPLYYRVLATPVPAAQGLAHFRNVHIWNLRATGARTAFEVSASPEAPLQGFRLDHIAIDAQSAGKVADAKNWMLSELTIRTADRSQLTFTGSFGLKLKGDTGVAETARP
jgi:hypothetical protein